MAWWVWPPAISVMAWQSFLGKEASRRGVNVRLVESQIVIDLYVVLEYGMRISEVARNISESVRFNVEKALGIPVAQVNVHVQGLRVSSSE